MKSERQQAILDLLDQHHSVTVNEISNTLGVSDMTIRRDLAELVRRSRRGILRGRSHPDYG